MQGVYDFRMPRDTGGAGCESLGVGTFEKVEEAHAPTDP
jgi:hypothetical protein